MTPEPDHPLGGPRVKLRELRTQGSAAIFACSRDPQVTKYMHWDPHPDLAATKATMAPWLQQAGRVPRTDYDLAVEVDGALIGMVRIAITNSQHHRGVLDYTLHPRWWGRGLGTELATMLIDFGFTTLGLRRIEATCHPTTPDPDGSWRRSECAMRAGSTTTCLSAMPGATH